MVVRGVTLPPQYRSWGRLQLISVNLEVQVEAGIGWMDGWIFPFCHCLNCFEYLLFLLNPFKVHTNNETKLWIFFICIFFYFLRALLQESK